MEQSSVNNNTSLGPHLLLSDLFLKLSPSLKSHSLPIPPFQFIFLFCLCWRSHIHCCLSIQLGNGEQGTDVRVRNNRLHCQNCYSNDEGKLFTFTFCSNIHFHFPPNNCNFHFQGWSSAKCDCDWRKKIYTRLSFTSTAWVASWPVLDRVKLLLSDCNVSCIRSNTAPQPPPHQIQVNQSFSANTHIPQYNLLRSINYTRCILYSAKHVNCKMLIGIYNQYPV